MGRGFCVHWSCFDLVWFGLVLKIKRERRGGLCFFVLDCPNETVTAWW